MRATLADHEQMLGGKDPLMVHTLTQVSASWSRREEREEGKRQGKGGVKHRRVVVDTQTGDGREVLAGIDETMLHVLTRGVRVQVVVRRSATAATKGRGARVMLR